MSKEQAVAEEANVEESSTTEDSGAQENELESLLNEWDKPAEKPQETEQDDAKSRLEFLEREYTSLVVDKEIASIKALVPGLPEEYGDTIIESKVQSDKRLVNLWQQRRDRPKDWERAKQAIASELNKTFPKPEDPDTAAVVAAVKGAAKPSPEQSQDTPNVAKMTDQAFYEWKAELLSK